MAPLSRIGPSVVKLQGEMYNMSWGSGIRDQGGVAGGKGKKGKRESGENNTNVDSSMTMTIRQ
jgi:hypothetical protein